MPIKFNDKEISALVFDFDGAFYSMGELQDRIFAEARKRMVDILISKFKNCHQSVFPDIMFLHVHF